MKKAMGALALCLVAATVFAADKPAAPEKGSAAEKKKVDWSFTPDPKLPNVLILGDSISIGYGLQLREVLKGKANVYRPVRGKDVKTPENCAGTTTGVQRIDAWLNEPGVKWDVIHFNFGLHDLKHVKTPGGNDISTNLDDPQQATVEQYSKNLEQIVAKLKGTGAKLIFATTTPCPETSTGRTKDMPPKYNEAALKIMKANGIEVDDLYNVVLPNEDKWQLPSNVHFNPAGYRALAEQVGKVIEADLPAKK